MMEQKIPWQKILRGVFLPLFALLFVLIFQVLEATHLIDEYYTKGISRGILKGISAVTSQVAFSVAEPLVLLFLAVYIVFLIRLLSALISRRDVLARLVRLTDLIAVVLIVFLVSWGFNYRQIGLTHISADLAPAETVTGQDLEHLVMQLIHEAETERAALGLSNEMVFRYQGDMERAALAAYEELGSIYPELQTPIGRPKPLLTSRLFSQLGIAGIFIPFTAEANYNADQHELLRPAAILHELAHLKGIAREGEANFMAYLASRNAKDPGVRYSGTMLALIQSVNALEDRDREAAAEAVQSYSRGMILDLQEYNRYWRQFQGGLADRSRDLNDWYLKTQGQEAGVGSYQEMIHYLFSYLETKKR